MIDRAADVAAFLVEHRHLSLEPADLWVEICRRWPGITDDEVVRGAQIAAEILAGTIMESEGTREAVEAAVADWGEAEFQEIADGTGVPINAVREAMRAIQRGDATP